MAACEGAHRWSWARVAFGSAVSSGVGASVERRGFGRSARRAVDRCESVRDVHKRATSCCPLPIQLNLPALQ